MSTLRVDGRARLRGAKEVGAVKSITEGYADLVYEHGEGRVTFGSYPVELLEAIEEEERLAGMLAPPAEEERLAGTLTPSTPKEHPRARAQDVLGGKP